MWQQNTKVEERRHLSFDFWNQPWVQSLFLLESFAFPDKSQIITNFTEEYYRIWKGK